jgi:hypothetical protein
MQYDTGLVKQYSCTESLEVLSFCRSHNEQRPPFVKTPALPDWKPDDDPEEYEGKEPKEQDGAAAGAAQGEGKEVGLRVVLGGCKTRHTCGWGVRPFCFPP